MVVVQGRNAIALEPLAPSSAPTNHDSATLPPPQPHPTVASTPPTPSPHDDGSSPPFPRNGIRRKWLKLFVEQYRDQKLSWTQTDFLKPEDITANPVNVTADSLDNHRARIAAAAAGGDGKPTPVRYEGIPFEQMTTDNVCMAIVKPDTEEHKCSYTELLEKQPLSPSREFIEGETWVAPATAFVSHAWRYRFVDVAEVLISLNNLHGEEKPIYLWFDVFTVNQHQTNVVHPTWWYTTFKDAVGAIGHTVLILLPWLDPVPLTRAWCIWEILSTIDTGAHLDIKLPAVEQIEFAKFLVANGASEVASKLVAIDVLRAEAWNANDRDNILQAVHESEGGASAVNKKIKDKLRLWVTATAATCLSHVPDADRPMSKLLMDVASLYNNMGDYARARVLFEEALVGRREKLGEDHPNTLACMNNLANVYAGEGNYDGALPLYKKSLSGLSTGLEDTDARVNTLLNVSNLANVFFEKGMLQDAEELFREAFKGFESELGPSHEKTLSCAMGFAGLLHARNNNAEAEELYRIAHKGFVSLLSESHPTTLNALNGLGNLLGTTGRLEEAEALMREALEGRRRELGDRHPDTLVSVNNLAIILKNRNNFTEAESLYFEALAGKREELGSKHPSTLTSTNNLGILLLKQGKLEAAEPLMREALEGRRSTLGDKHNDTIATKSNLAVVLKNLGRIDEARPLYIEVIEARRADSGDESQKFGDACMNYAVFLKATVQDLAEASVYFTNAADAYASACGPDSEKAVSARESAAKCV